MKIELTIDNRIEDVVHDLKSAQREVKALAALDGCPLAVGVILEYVIHDLKRACAGLESVDTVIRAGIADDLSKGMGQ